MAIKAIRDFMRLEAAGGILLAVFAALAVVVANTPLNEWYQSALDFTLNIPLGQGGKYKSVLLLINDGLMAIFFLLIGLELKREILDGELASRQQIMLPAFAAFGGMAVPAIIFVLFNLDDPTALRGWAIPAATDIAFALGVLSLLGTRAPLALKVFLTALAVLDDIGAIVVIALFYTEKLSVGMLGIAILIIILLVIMNRLGVMRYGPYLVVGSFLWLFVLKSGIHATLAGVVLGLCIPLRGMNKQGKSPLRQLEHALHPWSSFVILPIFAFANAGVRFIGLSDGPFPTMLAVGIAAGLFFGKQIGVFGFTWLALVLGMAKRPGGASMRSLYGVACLCGIGFTMSLFIGNLAFKKENLSEPTMPKAASLVTEADAQTDGQAEAQADAEDAPATETPNYAAALKIGVIGGSLMSGIVGFIFLATSLPSPNRREDEDEPEAQEAA